MMSVPDFKSLFDGKQTAAKDEADYTKKQLEEPIDFPAPKRGRLTSPLGPIADMTMEQIIHQNRGKP
jgi:hypothetical protein